MKRIIKYIKEHDYIKLIILVLLCSLPIFLVRGIIPLDDTIFHINRINLITDEISLGNIFSKMYHGYLYGYGYGSGLFYPDLFLYIPVLLHYFGLSITISYKIFIILINIASIVSMYYVVLKISNDKKASLISSIIYAFSSYRLTDMYQRGALGETLSFVFVPIVIYGIYLIIYDDYRKNYILILGMTGLIYSHLVTSYMMVIILLIICLANIRKFLDNKGRIIYLCMATLITLLLTSYYLVPLIEQLIDRNFYIYDCGLIGKMYERAVPFYKSILEIPYNNIKWIPNGLGIIFLIIIISKLKENKIFNLNFENILFFIGIGSLVLSTNIFPWQYFNKIFGIIQFPWRFYLIATVFLTISGSMFLAKKNSKRIILIFIIMLIPLSGGIFNYILSGKPSSNMEIENENYNVGLADYLPKEISYMNVGHILREEINPKIVQKKDYLIINYDKESNEFDYYEVPYIYYLGYTAEYNNKKLKIVKNNRGLVSVDVSNIDKGKIKVYYKETVATTISMYITIVGIILLCGYIYIYKRRIKDDYIGRKNSKTKNIRRSKARSKRTS